MRTTTLIVAALFVIALAAVPSATAKPDEPVCPQYYNETHLGPVTVVQNGCKTSIVFHGLSPCDWEPAWC